MIMRQFITLRYRKILLEYPISLSTKYRACSNKPVNNAKNLKNYF